MFYRKKLDQLIQKNSKKNWWSPKLFKKHVLQYIPKELKIIALPPEKNNYNCFIYALQLEKDTKIVKDCSGFIYHTFFWAMIEKGVLKVIKSPKNGDYIVYYNKNCLTHVGILNGRNIKSKWAWGPLIQHKKFHIPESWGKQTFYIKALSINEAKKTYWKFRSLNIKQNC